MRVYFLTCVPAVLKLNGNYAGRADAFERYIHAELNGETLAELVPGGNLQPVNFFLDESLLSDPPQFADVYLAGGDLFVYVRRFESRETRIKVIFQTNFHGNLITLFSQGETYLSAEGKNYSLTPLGYRFGDAKAEERQIAGFPVLALESGGALILLSQAGEIIFMNRAESFGFGPTFKVTTPFETCTAAKATCEYGYDGEKLTLLKSRTEETFDPGENQICFAFFESILTFGDFEKYLSEELKPRAGQLREYLGEYTGVTVPTERFYAAHPNENAAGLVYPKTKNLFEVKYFAVELKHGKVHNVYPAEA